MADRRPLVTARQLSVAPAADLLAVWKEAQLTQLAIGTTADVAASHADLTVRYYAALAEELALTAGTLKPG